MICAKCGQVIDASKGESFQIWAGSVYHTHCSLPSLTVKPNITSLRDYFAGKALAATAHGVWDDFSIEEIATQAYAMADAMLKARDKKP